MKKFSVFPLLAALAFFLSCQKQQTEEERKAEVERQVQDRLAAERLDAEKQRLAQEKASLEAREKALADRQTTTTTTTTDEEAAGPDSTTVVEEREEGRTAKRSTATYGMFGGPTPKAAGLTATRDGPGSPTSRLAGPPTIMGAGFA
jgi:uncharacterized protein YlxW (UPF0749 family)